MLQFSKGQPEGEKKQYAKIDKPGRYIAEVVKVEQVQSKTHADWKPGTRFLFRVLEEPFVGSFTSGLITSFWKVGNQLDTWCAALGVNGAELTDNISEDFFKKRRAVVAIEMNDAGYANVKAIYAPRPEDLARIAPRNGGKPAAATPAPQAAPAAQPQVNAAGGTAAYQAPAQTISTPPVAQRGPVTQDDSLPF